MRETALVGALAALGCGALGYAAWTMLRGYGGLWRLLMDATCPHPDRDRVVEVLDGGPAWCAKCGAKLGPWPDELADELHPLDALLARADELAGRRGARDRTAGDA